MSEQKQFSIMIVDTKTQKTDNINTMAYDYRDAVEQVKEWCKATNKLLNCLLKVAYE